jgi:hypothetical protein
MSLAIRPSVHATQSWLESTASNLAYGTQTLRLSSTMRDANDNSRSFAERTISANRDEVERRLQDRQRTGETAVNRLGSQIAQVEVEMSATEKCAQRVAAAIAALEEPRDVAKMRLRARLGRPHRETVRDIVEECLTRQLKGLDQSEQTLQMLRHQLHVTLQNLAENRQDLVRNQSDKRRAVESDVLCLSARCLDRNPPKTPVTLGSRLARVELSANRLGPTQWGNVLRDELQNSDVNLCSKARRLREKASAAQIDVKQRTEATALEVQRAFAIKNKTTESLLESLRQKQVELSDESARLRKSLVDIDSSLDATRDPSKLHDARRSTRITRPLREAVADGVTLALRTERDGLDAVINVLTVDAARTRENLRRLEVSLQQLERDVADKLAALQIDRELAASRGVTGSESFMRSSPPSARKQSSSLSPAHRSRSQRTPSS